MLVDFFNDFGFFIIFGVILVGFFVVTDYKIKKDNKRKYEETGIRPRYHNSDAASYLLKKMGEIRIGTKESQDKALADRMSGIMGIVISLVVITKTKGMAEMAGEMGWIFWLVLGVPAIGVMIWGSRKLL
ncbi:MAG: hypothetical protein IJF07_02195 [Lachnospiraceae bacterium]|nr:hypothetical protein [Lachnospiraceae bacterium]